MSNLTKTAAIIERNWEEVKSNMRRTWRNLTEEDVAGINGYKDLYKKLKETYSLEPEEVEKKINDFITKHDLQPNLSRIEEFKNALAENASEAKGKIVEAIIDSAETIQEKTIDWSESLTTYVKENPLKVLGFGVLAAVAFKKYLTPQEEE